MLTGQTELVLGPLAVGPMEYALEPWTPTILAAPQPVQVLGAARFRHRDPPGRSVSRGTDHSTGLGASRASALPWSRIHPRSTQRRDDRSGAGPPEGMDRLEPAGLPSQVVGRRGSARTLWEIDGVSGRFNLELRDPKDQGELIARPGAWVSGMTEIDLRRPTGRGGELVNWITEWRLELDPRHPRRLEAELDPGLELIDVQGSTVRGYRMERPGPATRVLVTLDGDSPSAVVRFLAHDPIPSEGPWRIPAMRPVDATWTRGRTTVILDELHVVRECREEAGRIVAPTRAEEPGVNRLAFEAESPRSVAELVFLGPRAELSCEVRGQLFIGNAPARFDCRLDWILQRGSTPELEVNLSPTWIPEQVQIQGLDDPVSWHPSALPSGATRLRVTLPAAVLARKKWTLSIRTNSTVPGGRGPLELPRVRAVGAATVDEVWLLRIDDGTVIRPTRARGLSWIDPGEVPDLFPQPAGTKLRESLAWRWTSAEAEGRVDRERVEQDPTATVRARARISPSGRELALDGTLVVRAGSEPLDAFPVWIDRPSNSLASWRFRDEAGVELALRPIERSAHARVSGFRDRVRHAGWSSICRASRRNPSTSRRPCHGRRGVPSPCSRSPASPFEEARSWSRHRTGCDSGRRPQGSAVSTPRSSARRRRA